MTPTAHEAAHRGPAASQAHGVCVHVVHFPFTRPPPHPCRFLGGAVLAEVMKDAAPGQFWISKADYEEHGARILTEKKAIARM